jgi:hypothetical protein
MKRLTLLLCTAAIAAVPAGQATAASAGPEATAAACNSVRYDGRSYVLYRQGAVRCKFARKWVRRLHRSEGRNEPRGWTCSSGSNFRTGGGCTKGRKAFGWHPGD